MKRSVQLLFASLAIVVLAAWVGHADQPVLVESSATAVTETGAGYRVYLDPSTGELTGALQVTFLQSRHPAVRPKDSSKYQVRRAAT